MTTWRKEILEAMTDNGESWEDVESIATTGDLDADFDGGYGVPMGAPFTLWTKRRVYFPASYEGGSEWCMSVSRNPDGIPISHVGG
jgi:hypothetical protein